MKMGAYCTNLADLPDSVRHIVINSIGADEEYLGALRCIDAGEPENCTYVVLTSDRVISFIYTRSEPKVSIDRSEIKEVEIKSEFPAQIRVETPDKAVSWPFDAGEEAVKSFADPLQEHTEEWIVDRKEGDESLAPSLSDHDETSGSTGAMSPRSVVELSRAELREELQSIDGYEFEYFVADLWSEMGWQTEVTQGSADAGIDVVATMQTPYPQKTLIQTKRYQQESSVGSPEIQQYASLRQQEPNTDYVVVVTTSTFSQAAVQLAQQLNVKTVDVTDLISIIEDQRAYDVVGKYLEESVSSTQVADDQSGSDSTDIDVPPQPSRERK